MAGYNSTALIKLSWSGSDTPCWFNLKPSAGAAVGKGANSDNWSFDISARRNYRRPQLFRCCHHDSAPNIFINDGNENCFGDTNGDSFRCINDGFFKRIHNNVLCRFNANSVRGVGGNFAG